MDKKYLALIGLVIILISVILTLVLFQSLIQNETAKADSFELQIKDAIPSGASHIAFARIDNETLLNSSPFYSEMIGNCTNVSEMTFLSYINTYVKEESAPPPHHSTSILRVKNTFYLSVVREGFGSEGFTQVASCTP